MTEIETLRTLGFTIRQIAKIYDTDELTIRLGLDQALLEEQYETILDTTTSF